MDKETPVKSPQADGSNDVAPSPAVTSAADFRKRRENRDTPKTHKLASGLTVQYVRKSVEGLMLNGVIPKDVANKILNMQAVQGGAPTIKVDDLPMTIELQKTVLRESLVSPRLVTDHAPDYDNNEICFEDLEQDEINELYNLSVGVSNRQVTSFRK